MKIYICMLLLFIPLLLLAQETKTSDSIIGTWWTAGKESTVEIYKVGNEFRGKITWLKIPLDENGKEKSDPKNPKPELRARKRLGMIIMENLIQKGPNEWGKGNIYDPKSGNTYKCNIKLKDNNTMLLRGYIGISMIGRTETWLRAK
ncbi:MAG TPA: DUF2147 domain-containing protein [Candidatus Cloacimonadota bacterium]|nr:DUF2147 domain-containing protein [Candidatus Cloacimonadota bacterium]HPT71299.1 DUF2147 domain-containing protein [Candidatus Cloacimonadota bacterium]